MRAKSSRLIFFAVLALCCLLFTACGGSSQPVASTAATDDYDYYTVGEPAPATAPTNESIQEAGVPPPADVPAGVNLPQDDRMVIITADMRIETLDFAATCDALQAAAVDLGGYVSQSSVDGGEESTNRDATFTMKIPAQMYSQFMNRAGQSGNVIYRTEQSEDVTNQYVDVNSRLKTLRAEEAWLLEQLESASTLSNMIDLRDRLSDVQYQIESYTATQRTLENLSSYSTVNILVEEVIIYTEPPVETYGEQISEASNNAWQATADFFKAVGLFIVAVHPFLIFCVIVLAVVLIVLKATKEKRMEKKAANASMAAAYQSPPMYQQRPPHPYMQKPQQAPPQAAPPATPQNLKQNPANQPDSQTPQTK